MSDMGESVRSDMAEYHFRPNPHFVMSEATWESVKAQFTRDVSPLSLIAGQTGAWSGTPVYIDDCPWDCRHSGGSTPHSPADDQPPVHP